MLIIFTLLLSILFQFLTIKFENKYNIFNDCNTKTHAIHKIPTPRVGGVGIFLSFTIYIFFLSSEYNWLVYSGAIIFFLGLYEDWHGDTSKIYRLGAMALSTIVAIYFSGYVAQDSGFFILPYFIAVVFTIFTVVGLSSAINFIDGLNGLASGVCLITLTFFGIVAYLYNDLYSLTIILILLGSIFGFFIWNYPKGKIFLGDGGAYFLGFIMAILSIMIANRNEEISLWYPLVALAYPVIETIVTINRRIKRKKRKGIPFFEAEKTHLHTMTFRRKTKNNVAATNKILVFHLYINIFAFIFQQYIFVLFLLLPIAYYVYMMKYRRIIKFQKRNPFRTKYLKI